MKEIDKTGSINNHLASEQDSELTEPEWHLQENEDETSDLDALEGLDQPDENFDTEDLQNIELLDLPSDESDEKKIDEETEFEWQSQQATDSNWLQEIDEAEAAADTIAIIQNYISPETLKDSDWAGYSEIQLKQILEAALFAYGKPLSFDKMFELFPEVGLIPSKKSLNYCLQELKAEYQHRGIQLVQVRSGFRIQTTDEMAPYIQKLWDERPSKYSRATLETLALIAYRQPITRGEIEDVRGVSVSSQIIKSMMERDWIRIVGHRDVPGRPSLFATTKGFLDYFGLENLNQLPTLSEIREMKDLEPELGLDETETSSTDSKETTFSELVEKIKSPGDVDPFQHMDKELADDLAETTVINDKFEALLAAQRAELLKEQEEEFSREQNRLTDSIEQDQKDENTSLFTTEEVSESRQLSEEEQFRIIEAKLAEQQALIEHKDKEDRND